MPRGPINQRERLRPGELPRRYLRRHEDAAAKDALDDAVDYWGFDDYWDPWNQATDLDFEIERLWHDIVDIAFGAPLDLSRVTGARPEPVSAAAPEPVDGERLAEALHERLQLVASRDRQAQFLARASFEMPREALRVAGRREPALLHWIGHHRGPSTMLIMLAPLWVRPVDTWSAPAGADEEAITRSLITHLFGRYAIPSALFSPWSGTAVPSIKWTSWLVLIGGGASLRRAAPRFGWQISPRLVHHLFDAPAELEPIEAVLWAEVAQRGGSQRELDRLRAARAYVFDTTEPTEPAGRRDVAEHYRAFWLSTVDWLVRHRDALTDDTCASILEWAMHRHTEDVARDVPPAHRFSWSGRTPNSAGEQAHQYRRAIEAARDRRINLTWHARGWNWDRPDGWTVRELTSSHELAAESAAMRHCVHSYGGRCVQGLSAIFTLQREGARAITIELDPRTRRVVQARGVGNRACTPDEDTAIAQWLAEVSHRPRS